MGGLLFSIFVSIIIPIIFLCYSIIKKYYIPFLLGMGAFLISQIALRIPLLNYLSGHSSLFMIFSMTKPFLYAVIIGLSAGIFEGLARFFMIYFFMKQRDWKAGFLFGAGHGGVEAILFVGIQAVMILFNPMAIAYDGAFFIGGVERFFAMILHIGLSIIVLQAIVQKKYIYLIIAILLHGFVDSLVGILPLFLAPDQALVAIEVSLACIAIIVFIYSFSLKRREVL